MNIKKLLPFITGVLVIGLVYLFMPSKKQHKEFDGRVTLGVNDQNPYGCFATYKLLPELFPGVSVISSRQSPQEWSNISFDSTRQLVLIVAKYFNPTETDLHYLTVLAERGNYVVISALEMNYTARRFFRLQQLYLDADKDDRVLDGQPMIRLLDTFSTRIDTSFIPGAVSYGYPGVDYSNIFTTMDTALVQRLGYNGKGEVNLLGYKAREGVMLLHSAPLTFSNFFILYHQNYRYLQQLLSLTVDKPSRIIWDEYFLRGKGQPSQKGVLSVILQYRNFRWAFALALVALGFLLITGVKRKQRLIPEHKKPVNESLEFVTVIGKLYYEKGDHLDMAHKMVQFFLEHIRVKYNLNTQYINSAFAQLLSYKSGITAEHAQAITEYINKTRLGEMDALQLTAFYELLHKFYKTT